MIEAGHGAMYHDKLENLEGNNKCLTHSTDKLNVPSQLLKEVEPMTFKPEMYLILCLL